jgi:hypothetical protein
MGFRVGEKTFHLHSASSRKHRAVHFHYASIKGHYRRALSVQSRTIQYI